MGRVRRSRYNTKLFIQYTPVPTHPFKYTSCLYMCLYVLYFRYDVNLFVWVNPHFPKCIHLDQLNVIVCV